jgi:hypothetical protein
MTKAQIEANPTYQRLLARAQEECVYISFHETNADYDKHGNITRVREWFIVNNPTHMTAYSVQRHGQHLTCNCPAGSQDIPLRCKHTVAVTAWLISHATSYGEWSDAVNLMTDDPTPETVR